MHKLKGLALREFAALEMVTVNKETCRRDAIKKFKKSVQNYFTLLEFEENRKHFKVIMYYPTTIKTVDFGTVNSNPLSPVGMKWYYEIPSVKKKTLVFSTKAGRRVSPQVSDYVKLFKQDLDGSTVDYGHKIVQQRADYHLGQYRDCIKSTEPTKEQLIRTFLTHIRDIKNTTRPRTVEIFASFNIPSIKKYEIFYDWKDLQPTSLTFRTFEI